MSQVMSLDLSERPYPSMSTLQHTNPLRANQSMTDESGLPGTLRSNVGCDAIDEPCTNRIAGLPADEPTNFSHRKSFTPPLRVQCSAPVTGVSAAAAFAAGTGALSPKRVCAEPLISASAIRALHRVPRACHCVPRAPR